MTNLGSSRLVLLLVLVGTALAGSGCVAAAGVAGDIASGSANAVESLVRAGKAQSYVLAPWEEMVEATRRAGKEMALTPVREEKHPEQRKLVYRDDRRQEVTVTVIRRTANVTELRVDVGLTGVIGLGKLTLKRILEQAPEVGPAETHPATHTRVTPLEGSESAGE